MSQIKANYSRSSYSYNNTIYDLHTVTQTLTLPRKNTMKTNCRNYPISAQVVPAWHGVCSSGRAVASVQECSVCR